MRVYLYCDSGVFGVCTEDFDLKISAGLLQRKSSRPFGNLIFCSVHRYHLSVNRYYCSDDDDDDDLVSYFSFAVQTYE